MKERHSGIQILLPDPIGSVFFRLIKTGLIDPYDIGTYEVEGVGKDHLPTVMDISLIDEAMQYDDEMAFSMCEFCTRLEGIFPSLSGGGNLAGVKWLIDRLQGPSRILTLIQDSGTNCMSKLLACTYFRDR